MVMSIYKKALAVLAKKPFKLWGISILSGIISTVLSCLFGLTIGVGICLNLLITTSMTMVYLHGYKGEDVKVVQLFDGFKDWATIKRVVCGLAWMNMWLFLYALVPIAIGIVGAVLFGVLSSILSVVGVVLAVICLVAGIVAAIVFVYIKSYAYRFTPYILVCEHDVPITEAFHVSAKRTNGYKGKMFVADLLISVIMGVAGGLLGLLSAIPYIGFLFTIANVVVIIANVVLVPLFSGLVQAAFYVEIENINKSGYNPYAAQNPYMGQNPYAGQQQNPYMGQQNPYAGQQNPYAGHQNPYAGQPQGFNPQNGYNQPQGAPQQQNPNNNQ